MAANNSQAGKGSGRRRESFKNVQNNWDEIPNFGYKPRWAKELENPSDEKINRYPDHKQELYKAIYGNKLINIVWTDDSKLNDLKPNKQLKNIFKKYNLDDSCKEMYIWEVIEKMHDFRPF